MSEGRRRLLALLRFDLRVGVRLAVRAMAPVFAAAIGASILLFDGFPIAAVAMLFGDEPSAGARLAVALVTLGFASAAAPRVCHGRDGWLRHLPASGRAQRRAALLAVTVAQAPLLLGLALLALAVTPGIPPLGLDLAGLLLGAASAALAVMPVEGRRVAAPLALAASALCVASRATLPLGAALLLVADRTAGPIASRRGRPPLRPTRAPAAPDRLGLRIAWRALGLRLLAAYLWASLPLGAVGLFLANNELDAGQRGLAIRLAGGAAVVLLVAGLADLLAVRRPVWPWARSLPWSAARRSRADALLLGGHALPLVALTATLDPAAAAPVLGALPLLAACAAGAVRRGPERRTGASGEVLGVGFFVAGGLALQPMLGAAFLLATPFALAAAAERERGLRVSRWLERHHLAVGDPQAWSR